MFWNLPFDVLLSWLHSGAEETWDPQTKETNDLLIGDTCDRWKGDCGLGSGYLFTLTIFLAKNAQIHRNRKPKT